MLRYIRQRNIILLYILCTITTQYIYSINNQKTTINSINTTAQSRNAESRSPSGNAQSRNAQSRNTKSRNTTISSVDLEGSWPPLNENKYNYRDSIGTGNGETVVYGLDRRESDNDYATLKTAQKTAVARLPIQKINHDKNSLIKQRRHEAIEKDDKNRLSIIKGHNTIMKKQLGAPNNGPRYNGPRYNGQQYNASDPTLKKIDVVSKENMVLRYKLNKV